MTPEQKAILDANAETIIRGAKTDPCETCSDVCVDADEEPCSLCGPPDFPYHDSKCEEP